MKTKIIIPIVALSLVLVTKSILAQTPTSNPKEVRNEIKEEKQIARVTVTEIREEKKSVLSELKLKKIEVVYKAIKMGLEKRHAALSKIKDKIYARIDKNPMKRDQLSIDVIKSTLEDDFATADDNYIKDMTTLKTQFEKIDASVKPSELIKGLKDTVNLVREDLNSIKKVLTSAVTALAKAPKLEVTKTEE